MKIIISIAALLGSSVLVVGCVRDTQFVVDRDHPANSEARSAAVPERSNTLRLATTEPSQEETATASPSDAHAGHAGDGASAGAATQPATTQGVSDVVYTCPMHPEVISDQPGRCPKCRMRLVSKEQD